MEESKNFHAAYAFERVSQIYSELLPLHRVLTSSDPAKGLVCLAARDSDHLGSRRRHSRRSH